MAQKSILWTTSGVGGGLGDGIAEYTQAEVIRWQRQTFISDPDEGVLTNYENELEVTGVASPMSVDTGGAFVHGFPYWNTVASGIPIASPLIQPRIDRVVVRADWATQLARVTLLGGVEGAGVPPAYTQTDGVIWDIPLFQASITAAGVITLTDEREYIHPNMSVDTTMLDDDAVTLPKMAANSVDSDQYVDGSIDLVHMSPNSVDSPQYVNASIDLVHMSNNSVDTPELVNDSVDDTKAGNRIIQIYRRQGGNAAAWATGGVAAFTPTAVRMQVGVREWAGAGVIGASVTVTFPVAFSNTPVVLITQVVSSVVDELEIHSIIDNITDTDFEITWKNCTDASTYASVIFHWMAIGPE